MKTLNTLFLFTVLTAPAALAQTVNFDDAKPGEAPAGWTATKTGKGESKWAIAPDETAPSKPQVLKQSGEADYPVALKNDSNLKDGFVEVKLKAVSGQEDQAGGVVQEGRQRVGEVRQRGLVVERLGRRKQQQHGGPAILGA